MKGLIIGLKYRSYAETAVVHSPGVALVVYKLCSRSYLP